MGFEPRKWYIHYLLVSRSPNNLLNIFTCSVRSIQQFTRCAVARSDAVSDFKPHLIRSTLSDPRCEATMSTVEIAGGELPEKGTYLHTRERVTRLEERVDEIEGVH